jgi:hypothetical protein
MVSKNSLVQRASNNIPMMHNNGQSVTVRHREFVRSINGSKPFTTQASLDINPGLQGTFPWLAGIATRFQEYEFKGLVFHYVPTSGTFNGSTAALGSVMLQTTYRATDTAPQNKAEMMNEYWATEVVPFETACHPLECDPKENPFSIHYIRNTAITSGEPLMYDLARTFVATQGMSSDDIVGDLWVTYEVELKKPLINSPVTSSPAYLGANFAGGTAASFFSGVKTSQGTLPLEFGARTITIPAGTAGYVYLAVTIQGVGMTSPATLSWPTTAGFNNLLAWPYNPTTPTSNSTVITGTNPVSNSLTYEIGVYLDDVNVSGIITYPVALITGGLVSNITVTAFTVPQA